MSKFLRARRTWFTLVGGVALVMAFVIPPVAFADLPGGCDFAPTGTTPSCLGALTGSNFAGGDGNLLTSPTNFGTTDWQNVSGLHTGIDLASGSGDNAFGQGTKEDNANVTVVSGSIPPNKSDLTRFYEASEFANGSNFLYLAWERTNVLGSANMDFEINQVLTPGLGNPGPHTIVRTAGDLLITFDFNNGGGRPSLGLLTWVTTGSTSQCFSSNSLPCWGNQVNLNGTDSVAAVNNLDPVTDPFLSAASNPLAALTFGEAAINLTLAGVFPPATCEALGSVFLKSRASASFGAEVKDFVAPVPVTVTNCGQVTIIKNTDPRNVNQDFSYTSTIANPVGISTSPSCTADTTPSSFTLNDGSPTTNTEDCTKVPAGTYTVVEGAEPPNFVLESLTCTATGAGSSGAQHAAGSAQADITLTAGGHVTCTYVNLQQLGAIKITKTSSKGTHPGLDGASFSITSGGTPIPGSPFTSANGGVICVDHLPFGTYSVQETAAPTGYAIDDTSAHDVTVSANSTCGDTHEAAFSATDTPLSKITVTFHSYTGTTSATVTCTGEATMNLPNDTPHVLDNLVPGTYTCTVVIDP
jgi:hypothetical protein